MLQRTHCWGLGTTSPAAVIRRVATLLILAAAIVPAAFAQDTTPPTLAELVIDTPIINTTTGDDEFIATLRIQDDLSGTRSSVQIRFDPPLGSAVSAQYGTCSRISGDALDGVYECRRTFPQLSPAGVWSIGIESIIDLADNRDDLSSAELDALSFPSTFENTATVQDTTPPTLAELVIDTPIINTTTGDDEFIATLRIQDDLSGTRSSVQIRFDPPLGSAVSAQYGTCSRISGDALDGVYECRRTFPQLSPAGVWSIGIESIIDLADNRDDLSSAELDALSFPSTFELIIADIEVSPIVLDLGDVAVGLSAPQMITVTNLGGANLVVIGIGFKGGGGGDFSTSSSPALPATLFPDQTLDLEITFAPSTLGAASAILQILSNDPDQPLLEVVLSGNGVVFDPSDALGTILEFFDQSVMDVTLVGSGPGASGARRLAALRNKLEAAGDLLDEGEIEDACNQLLDAFLRTDGVFPPPNFASGPAAPDLATQIQNLRTTLDCGVQCGDVNRGGNLGPEDTDRVRDYLVRLTPEPPFELLRCSVSGAERSCTVADLARMRRWTDGLSVTLQNGCRTAILDPGSP